MHTGRDSAHAYEVTACVCVSLCVYVCVYMCAQTDKATPRRVTLTDIESFQVHQNGYLRVHCYPKRFPAVYKVCMFTCTHARHSPCMACTPMHAYSASAHRGPMGAPTSSGCSQNRVMAMCLCPLPFPEPNCYCVCVCALSWPLGVGLAGAYRACHRSLCSCRQASGCTGGAYSRQCEGVCTGKDRGGM